MADEWSQEKILEWWRINKELLKLMKMPPSPEQEEVLRCNAREILLSGGEQAGKSWTASEYLLTRLYEGKLYWLVGDDYEQAKPEMTYVIQALDRIGYLKEKDISMPLRGPWQVKFQGKRIVSKSAVDIRKLSREAPDGIIMCEAAQMSYDVYLKLRGRAAPKRAWLLMVGTLESSTDWYSNLYKRWQAPNPEGGRAFCIPSWANLKLYPKGREDPEIKRLEAALPEDIFLMRFGAVPSPPPNLVFPTFDYKVHVPGDVHFKEWVDDDQQERLPVEIWGDPGYSGSFYSLEIVQIVGPDSHYDGIHVHVIDEVRAHNATTPEMIEACTIKPWWENAELAVLDVASKQHHANQSVYEMWAAELPTVCNKIFVEDGIARHRMFLKEPGTGAARIFFNENCGGAFQEYGRWKRRRITDGVNQSAKPAITNCDAMKAINYGLVEHFGYVEWGGEPARVRDPFS